MTKKLAPLHPGEVLREEFLIPLNLSAGKVADLCGVPRTRIERIAAETTGITADTALRLARCFGTTPHFWLNMQIEHDIRIAQKQAAKELEKIQTLSAA